MVRRVKAYLKSMKVITDEDQLHRMSQEAEPPSGGIPPPPPVINTVRKRNPSPSPSAVSSSSSTPSHYSNGDNMTAPDKRIGYLATAPNKFGKSLKVWLFENWNNFHLSGAASPQAVKKLLSLSEQSKPRHKSNQPSQERDPAAPSTPSATVKTETGKVDRADQPTPVNLTSESSSVIGRQNKEKTQVKVKTRKPVNPQGSSNSTDSGFGQTQRDRQTSSESPQLPPRQRRYHQHYHRPHHHGKH